MNSILILFAHPKFEQSRTNKHLVQQLETLEGVTFHDLYESYPDFHINISFEKELLAQHDILVWHHPLYWYSCPPLMKQWIDLVLEYNWAYGPKGQALQHKKCLNVITTGGSRALYCAEGSNHYSVNEFLRPFEQTARLCHMQYLPPFTVMGTHQLSDEQLTEKSEQYVQMLKFLQQDCSPQAMKDCAMLNDILELN
ncbi:NAD(P)H-dependent oxidoreductase [Pseudozobellia sp. WGM2]|uniref:glutathione-regulated potassium-efflux system oxidoreductase KefF n=1 Tax=Pseudozobellia sp. WGM2 TaxID=2787625 RepID=UPI001ADF4B01|nr:NAD(P)H-dependent oxidoreductase [Pseudozobellia sp. WGM2]